MFLAISMLVYTSVFAQFSISGTVKDSLLNPIVGATIKIADTYKGTFSDNNGYFKLNNLDTSTYVIEVSYIGYETQQLTVKNLTENREYKITLKESEQNLDELIVTATRVKEKAPIAHTNISYQEIEKNNLGQDMAFLLQNTTSLVSTSDAGAGVGYTGFRIRGSDATRINVTVGRGTLNFPKQHS